MSRLNAAGSSITDLIGVCPKAKLDGGAVAIWDFPELIGTQTYKTGEMVCLSGSVANAVGLTKPGIDASGFGIVGFAADDATGTGSTITAVYVVSPETIYVANVGHSVTSANAQTAALDVGQRYGLTSLSGRTYVDKQKTGCSNAMCRVIGFHGQDDVPTFYGKVYFQVLDTKCQLRTTWVIASSPLATAL